MTPDLSTQYLGLRLRSPLVPSSGPPTADVDSLKRLEAAGAGAVVLPSLFAEQVQSEGLTLVNYLIRAKEQYVEAASYLPEPEEFRIGAENYAELVRQAKRGLSIPVIASLNASVPGRWLASADEIERAGADALELNLYHLAADPAITGSAVEGSDLEVVRAVCARVKIPVAVKLNPFYSAIAHMAASCAAAGARGLVLFNRFYQPDIDLDRLEVRPTVNLSASRDLTLPLRWTAILRGRVAASLALTGGVHSGQDALKALLAGADAAMMCSELIQNGPRGLARALESLRAWMSARGYESVEQLKGSLSHEHCPDPEAFERAQYIKAVSGYHVSALT
ncbi:MAG: dihydroorotate dehydrogenase-like protein [Elusimicrobia bacterium]|nr:dihydroorotate dehydrogenase-like protein [Elusimicrobiota bacterium]